MMVQQEERFYCVGCGKMMRVYEAKALFRTGFFRVILPLGCCSDCSQV
ncbi:hypothetical protein M3194_18840 [Paenibacillus glycanilyticus]|nr:hypothetical protein [Paenibacillus glycanilyticus]MCM3629400.1 hypothetical protein [Paenibacillus glycanilyticus]